MNSRAKGCRGEREAAKYLTSLGFTASRMGRNGRTAEDLDIKGLDNLHVETKRNEAIDIGTQALEDAYVQAVRDAGASRVSVVLWRRNGARAWRVTWMERGHLVTAACTARLLSQLNEPQAAATGAVC